MQASALFLRACLDEEPSNLLIFGSGAQAQSHSSVFLRLYPSIKTCTFAVRTKNDLAQSLLEATRDAFPSVEVALVTTEQSVGEKVNLSSTVNAANIIVTVTSSTEALFASKDVASGTRLVLIGSYTPKMREVEDDLVRRAGIVAVDSAEACGHEAGELLSCGLTSRDMVELGKIINSSEAAQQVGKGGDVVMFKSVSRESQRNHYVTYVLTPQVGLGIQDVAIAKLVYDVAESRKLGQRVESYD